MSLTNRTYVMFILLIMLGMSLLTLPNDDICINGNTVFYPSIATSFNTVCIPVPVVAPTKEVRDPAKPYVLYICDKYGVDLEYCYEVVTAAIETSKEYSVDLHIVLALIEMESGFKCRVKSSKNAIGLMQVRARTETGKDVWFSTLLKRDIITREKDLYSPETNIRAGTYIFSILLDKYSGNVDKAIGAYLGSFSPSYIRKVKSIASSYKNL